MNRRAPRLRNELTGIIILKICVLTMLWFAFVHGARVPVDPAAMARHMAAQQGLSATGGPNGH
jgi:hypothetical protein